MKNKCVNPKSAAPCAYDFCMQHNHFDKCPAMVNECTNDCPACSYEAGADAMLAALRKSDRAVQTGNGSFKNLAIYSQMYENCGTLVFIPDDRKVE
jgi:hypothetical protein